MRETIHRTTIRKIGANAADFLAENMLIFFQEGAPAYLADFCYLIATGEGGYDIQVGDHLLLDEDCYCITAIGDAALENFQKLGHLTVRFDGHTAAEQPGTMHVSQGKLTPPTVGTQIRFETGT